VRYFTLNPCNGSTREPQTWNRCSLSCPAGQFVSRNCSTTESTGCTLCRAECPAGYYLNGTCDGTTTYDSTRCVPCKTCQAGQYRGKLDACNGSTTYDPVLCTACRTGCSNGEYIFGRCSGMQSLDETSCKACTVCQVDRPDQYNSIYRSCNGSDTEDIVVCALNPRGYTFPGA
jgi:hypothetical protein